ncbi:hypothetical protein [Candidatus Uabimicrobium amorphum]|uniref:Uncharacterized protein n=1 Tax=Uabimicrobium amorphum TaxID=2596890 RepID=A0A5S9F654_UABAM|nr:hypothetical protein [Candidatus Uabimicrobium amorphum]BBM86254.1 hypothetical protein UABAM_04640 [Candidatus Uabimicrobium amorphum]
MCRQNGEDAERTDKNPGRCYTRTGSAATLESFLTRNNKCKLKETKDMLYSLVFVNNRFLLGKIKRVYKAKAITMEYYY